MTPGRGPETTICSKQGVFPLKLPENCMILKKNLGGQGAAPWIRWCCHTCNSSDIDAWFGGLRSAVLAGRDCNNKKQYKDTASLCVHEVTSPNHAATPRGWGGGHRLQTLCSKEVGVCSPPNGFYACRT